MDLDIGKYNFKIETGKEHADWVLIKNNIKKVYEYYRTTYF